MKFTFNSNDLYMQPKIMLCKLDLKKLGFLDVFNLKINPTYCDISDLSFDIMYDNEFCEYIVKYMVLEVDGFGRFTVTEIQPDEVNRIKTVKAQSYEITLNNDSLTFKESSYFKLYDLINPEQSILGIISKQTGWKIEHVDGSLMNKITKLDIDNEQIYSVLMSTLTSAFKCYFLFDTMNMTISCYDTSREIVNSGIVLSRRNLIKDIQTSSASDDIVTALSVTGAEGVGINYVNPLSNNVIYDFSYFIGNKKYCMSQELGEAVVTWSNKIDNNRDSFANLVEQRISLSAQIIEKDSEMTILKGEMNSLLDIQSVSIQANDNQRLATVYVEIENKQVEINNKQSEIDAVKSSYQSVLNQITAITNSLSFSNNFTSDQLKELKFYIKTGSYQNENFIFTDVMTESQKIEVSKQLYDQGLQILEKVSKPLYEFSIDVSNFMFCKEYEEFTKNLKLGTNINVEVEENNWCTPKLLKVEIDYDNPENCKLTLSDKYRLSDDIRKFADNFGNNSKVTNKVNITAGLWDEPIRDGFYGKVNDYINNALNLANQEIINADNQEITIGSYGLRGKKYDDDTEDYSPKQVALTSNVLAFTDDGWKTTKTAIGEITVGDTKMYGLAAEVVMGNIVAGNNLTITNNKDESLATFVVDGNGAKLINADFTLENTKNKIILNPTDGIKIQKIKADKSWEDIFYANTDGNIIAKGISLDSAWIGGWTTTSDGITSPVGDYINSNGYGKLSLMSWTPTSATFNGNIYANNLHWNNGDGTYVVVFDDGGTMGGSWLTDGSVGADKLDSISVGKIYADWISVEELYAKKAWIEELYVTKGTFEELEAKTITAEQLSTKYLITDSGIFSGKMLVGKTGDYSDIHSEAVNLDAQHQNIQQLKLSSTAGFDFSSTYGGVNFRCGSIVNEDGTETKASVISQSPFRARDLVEVDGKLWCYGDIEQVNSGNTNTFNGATTINNSLTVTSNLSVTGETVLSSGVNVFGGMVVANAGIWIRGSVVLGDMKNSGVSGTFDIGGTSVRIDAGIIVGVG